MSEDIDLAKDGDEQPPEEHDNESHARDFVDAEEAADAAPVQPEDLGGTITEGLFPELFG